jgi:hypothetical protein
LARDGAEVGPYDTADVVRRAVRTGGHRPQHGEALDRQAQAVLA